MGRTALPGWLSRAGAFAALLVAGCQAGAPQQCRMGLATDVPLRFEMGHLFAAPLLNGRPTNMVLDTGAQGTTLSKEAAGRLGLPLLALNGYAEGIGGSAGLYGFMAETYQIGRLTGRHFRLTASEMSLSSPEITVDGLLGVDFLAAYDLDLDLLAQKATLYAAVDGCTAPSSALDGSLYVVPFVHIDPLDPRPRINVEIGGKTLIALVDTGSDDTVIFRNAARRLGLEISQLTADPHYLAQGVGPRTPDAARHVMETPISVGELTIQNMPVSIINQRSTDEVDMLLGLDFLMRVHAWFSFSSHTLILQFPPRPSPHAPS